MNVNTDLTELSTGNEHHDKPLTVEYSTRLLVGSYRFSQGSPDLQHLIFSYIHQLHPTWRIDDTFESDLEISGRKTVERFLKYAVSETIFDAIVKKKEPIKVSIIHPTYSPVEIPRIPLLKENVDESLGTEIEVMAWELNNTDPLFSYFMTGAKHPENRKLSTDI